MEEFSDILKKDEEVIATAKACPKTIAIRAMLPFLGVGTFILITFIPILCTVLGHDPIEWCMLIMPGLFYILAAIFGILASKAGKNYAVCLTQKRVIVKYGIFTKNYRTFLIERVTGNIVSTCNQSFFNRKDTAVSLNVRIELYPVGHNNVTIYTQPIFDGRDFLNKIEEVVKKNSEELKIEQIKE